MPKYDAEKEANAIDKAVDAFNGHLDVCSWCEKNPFSLCPTGAKLISEYGEATRNVRSAALHQIRTTEKEDGR